MYRNNDKYVKELKRKILDLQEDNAALRKMCIDYKHLVDSMSEQDEERKKLCDDAILKYTKATSDLKEIISEYRALIFEIKKMKSKKTIEFNRQIDSLRRRF